MLHQIVRDRFIEGELYGALCSFIVRYCLLERFIARWERIQGKMVFPTREEHDMFAIEVEGRHCVAHGLRSFRHHVVYCLPHLLKDDLDIRWKGTDVFVNRCEEL